MPSTLGIVASHKNNAWWDAWGAAYERAVAGVGQAHIVCVGDSLSQGFYTAEPYYLNGWVGRISTELASRTGATPGTGVLPVYEEFEFVDARTSVTGSWSTFAGGFFTQGRSASASATFVLGPVTCSAFRVTYATESDGGAWTATVDAGTPENYTSNGAASIATVDIDAGGVGSHTLTITATNRCYLVAVEAISLPLQGVKVSRIGRGSQETSALIANLDAKSSLSAFRSMSADLVIIEFGLNEANNGTTTATFEANLGALIDEAKAIGASVLVLAAPPPNTSFISEATWNTFRASMQSVATTKSVGFLDMADYWFSYAANAPYFFDNVHPNSAGHVDMARVVAKFVVETVAPSTPSTFVPSDIADLALWLDASHDASFSFSSGTVVSAWNDRSGNARNFTTVNGAPTRSASVNGLRAVWLDGVDDALSAGDTLDLGTSSLSIFAVVKRNLAGANQAILGKYKVTPADGGYVLLFTATNFLETVFDPGTLNVTDSTATTSLDSRVMGVIVDRSAGTVTQRLARATNGTNTFTPDSGSSRNTTHSLWMGALRNSGDTGFQVGFWLNGYVCEVVVYLQALDTTDRDQVEAYLAAKWGLL
jgi:lysophospholipase L1-like esterase